MLLIHRIEMISKIEMIKVKDLANKIQEEMILIGLVLEMMLMKIFQFKKCIIFSRKKNQSMNIFEIFCKYDNSNQYVTESAFDLGNILKDLQVKKLKLE